MRRLIYSALATSMLLLAACGRSANPEGQTENSLPEKVTVLKAVLQEGPQIHKFSGTVRPVMEAPLSSKLMGTVLEVNVRAGDTVKAGQLLAKLDARDVAAMVQKSKSGMDEAQMAMKEIDYGLRGAEANLKLANATLARYEKLRQEKSVSPQEFDEVQARQQAALAQVESLKARRQQVQAKIEQAQSDLQATQATVSYAEIRAPFDGIVTARQADPGSLAAPCQPLLTVEKAGPYQLETAVEESLINQLRLGETVAILIGAIGSQELKGTIKEIQPAADASSRTYLVKIALPAVAGLRSGMYGEASLKMGSRQGLWLPAQSIVHQGQLEAVYVASQDQHAQLRLVKLGEQQGEAVEVLAGLEPGEQVILEHAATLKDGSRVEVLR